MANKINKTELIAALSEKLNISKNIAEKYLEGFIEVITDNLTSGTEINITGFGAFSIRTRGARMGINPKTGQKMSIKASKSVGFKVGKTLREAVRES